MSEPDIQVHTAIYPEDSRQVEIRSVALGLKPIILIEFSIGDDDDSPAKFNISASHMGDDIGDVAGLLVDLGESLINAAKEGQVKHE